MKRLLFICSLLTFVLVAAACTTAPTAPPAEEAPATEEATEEEAMAEEATPEEAAEEGDDAMAEEANIVETAMAAGSFETLVTAVEAAGLAETLTGEGPFTVFAPTDDAFAALPEGTLDELLADPEGALTDILLYHVVSGEVLAADVVELDGQEVETVNGAAVTISVDGETVMVNDATVVTPDVQASNGVIHVIDSVLLPPSGEEEGAEMEETGDEATPTPEPEAEGEGDTETMDIVDTAVAAGSFETLVTAVTEAGLAETLSGEGPFTVFAPSDDAFAALPEGTLEELLAEPEGALTDILLYHVVSGEVLAADVVELDGQDVGTVQGEPISISVDGDSVVLNGSAVVVQTDIETSNGVIHVIDTVIMPPSMN